jgi:ADP-ribose pyrophosphatase YjhB (NUDIX family)
MMVRDPRGRILLLRRSQTVDHFKGCWELPGGKPFPGETIDKTSELKLDEEAGLYVPPTGVAGAVEGSIPGLRVALLILEGKSTDTEITLGGEHDAFLWVSLSQVNSLKLRPGFDKFLAQYQRQSRTRQAKAPGKKPAREKKISR